MWKHHPLIPLWTLTWLVETLGRVNWLLPWFVETVSKIIIIPNWHSTLIIFILILTYLLMYLLQMKVELLVLLCVFIFIYTLVNNLHPSTMCFLNQLQCNSLNDQLSLEGMNETMIYWSSQISDIHTRNTDLSVIQLTLEVYWISSIK